MTLLLISIAVLAWAGIVAVTVAAGVSAGRHDRELFGNVERLRDELPRHGAGILQ